MELTTKKFATRTVVSHVLLLVVLVVLVAVVVVATRSVYNSARGLCLLHPLRGQDRAGGAFRARKLRQMPPSRRALVTLWEKHAALTRFVMKWRWEIERVFGRLTCTAGGLSGLPAWVRRLSRVRRWVGVKIALYNARLTAREARQLAPFA